MKRYRILYFWLSVWAVWPILQVADVSGNSVRVIEDLQVLDRPERLVIRLSGKTDFKIIRLDDDTSMSIAFRDTALGVRLEPVRAGIAWVRELRFLSLPDQVVSLRVVTGAVMGPINAQWAGDAKTLTIRIGLFRKEPVHKKRMAGIKAKSAHQGQEAVNSSPPSGPADETMPPVHPEIPARESAVPSMKNGLKGGIDDFLAVFSTAECHTGAELEKAVGFCQKGMYREAVETVGSFLQSSPPDGCREAAFFLKGFAVYKWSEDADEFQLLEAVKDLQDAISYYSQSKYAPFALTMLGKMYLELNNEPEARGYFKIVLDSFKKYSGMPEVLFEMGRLSAKERKFSQAISFFEQVLGQYPGSMFEKQTRLEIGKAYFETNRFPKALEHLTALVDSDPRMIYASSDLLTTIGNCYYQTAKYPEAREVLAKAYNIFPDMAENHIVLTRIGDTYEDEKRVDKAKKIYEQVREKYPGTDGFIISSLRLANLEENSQEREKIYRMIMEDFPAHPMAELSRLRLAEMQQKEGQYRESIAMIDELLRRGGRALRREAEYLQEQSFQKYFQQMLSENNYPHILQMAEKQSKIINRMENPELYYLSGKAFFLGHLYPQAADYLGKAYRFYQGSNRPKDLLFLLGRASLETGALDDGMGRLNQYLREDPGGEHAAEATMLIGRGWLEKKEYQKAEESFQLSLRSAKSDLEKAGILLQLARVSAGSGRQEEKAERLLNAIALYSTGEQTVPAPVASAYRELGETFLAMGAYDKAADAFSRAIQYTRQEEGLAGLRYLLAEAYFKNKAADLATPIYREVAATGDPIWGKLAEERLRSIAVGNRLERT
ncbi:MAG: tetratricopeptide repeat protein [Thermodesulfobacteriota bacterium]